MELFFCGRLITIRLLIYDRDTELPMLVLSDPHAEMFREHGYRELWYNQASYNDWPPTGLNALERELTARIISWTEDQHGLPIGNTSLGASWCPLAILHTCSDLDHFTQHAMPCGKALRPFCELLAGRYSIFKYTNHSDVGHLYI